MSQTTILPEHNTSIIDNRSFHLPKYHCQLARQQQAKDYLLTHINQYLHQLQNTQASTEIVQLLNLRKKLIEKQGLSLDRIENLERIFLHYCTHIFKTGKHMTFERLQYEKSHMTMERFFAFMKDFGLTSAIIDGVSKEILDKNQVILLFKKVSINCKDLNFQQFISCLQKIGVLYYDSKLNYKSKQLKIIQDRKKRKQIYLKSLKRRKAALEAAKSKGENAEPNNNQGEEQDKVTDHQQQAQKQHEEANVEPETIQKETQQQKQLKQGQNGQNEQVGEQKNQLENQDPEIIAREQQIAELKELEENQVVLNTKEIKKSQLLLLTVEEKIQHFFQIIDVDNSVSFKKKMRELNLPLFQTKHKRAVTDKKIEGYNSTQAKQSRRVPQIDAQQEKRLLQLKNIIEQRKLQIKINSPHMSKQDYEQRRKKRMNEESQVGPKRILSKNRKLEVSQLETDLSSLSKMQFNKINFGKFNPQKLVQPSDQDDVYLEQYGSARRPQKSERRIISNLQATDKSSQMLLQKMKKRAQQIQTQEKLQQSKYSIAQDVNSTNEHQIRKNRLIERLLKMQKQ